MISKGEFEVKMQPSDFSVQGTNGLNLGRLGLNKTFRGDLTATSVGEMIWARTSIANSAGYTAIEQVTGTLAGKKGSFVLQHFGIMNRGENSLRLEVVPDSGTGELTGLKGSMKIVIEPGKHFYEFEYSI